MMMTVNSKLGDSSTDPKLFSGRSFYNDQKIRVRKVNNFKPDIGEMKLLRNMQQTLDSDGKNPFDPMYKPDSQQTHKRTTASGSAFYKPIMPNSPGKAKERHKHNIDLLPSQLNHIYVQ